MQSEMYNNRHKTKSALKIAHDIRSAIAVMELSLPLIEKNQCDIRILRCTIQRLRDIVDEVLSDQNNRLPSSIPLKPLLDEVLMLKKFEWSDKKCNLSFIADFLSATRVKGDANEIKSILSNLLNNAIEACNSDPYVKVHAIKVNEYIRIKISDNGVGISPLDTQNCLYGQSSKHLRLGLGLSEAKIYMEIIEGKIFLSSILNVGTTVTLFFKIDSRNLI